MRRALEEVLAQTAADELIVASQVFDHSARLRSYEIAMEAAAEVAVPFHQVDRATGGG